MFDAISRGIVYHSLFLDVKSLFKSFFYNKENKEKIEELENEFAKYMNSKRCVVFPFARTSLHYILKSKNFEIGTEIIMPPITIKPMMDIVINAGLKPVFVDINLDTLCFDINELKKTINNKTKVIFLTYLYGIVPNMDELIKVSKENNLFIIEDISHSLNAEFNNQKLGTFGDVAIYSASSIKTFDIYGGGLCITDDEFLADELKKFQIKLDKPKKTTIRKKIIIDLIRNFSTSRLIFSFLTFPALRWIKKNNLKKYQILTGARLDLKPELTMPKEWVEAFSSFQAEVAMKILPSIKNNDQKRIENVNYLKNSLKKVIRFPEGSLSANNVYWQFAIYVDNVNQFEEYLAKHGIDCSTSNLSLVSDLDIYFKFKKNLPNASYLKRNGVFIPAYPTLSEKDLKKIISVIKQAKKENNE